MESTKLSSFAKDLLHDPDIIEVVFHKTYDKMQMSYIIYPHDVNRIYLIADCTLDQLQSSGIYRNKVGGTVGTNALQTP